MHKTKIKNDSNTLLNINLNAISENFAKCKKQLDKNVECAAVVKANAYGLGIIEVTKHLIKNKCKIYFVAHLSEALKIRELNKNIIIYVLHGVNNDTIKLVHQNKIIPVINSLQQLKIINRYSTKKNITFNVALHFDTGINRLGLDAYEAKQIFSNNSLINKINVSLVMSHLSCGDEKRNPMNEIQLKRFKSIIKNFPNAKSSLSNSAGIFLGKKYHFDLVRPGIAIYGGNPFFDREIKLRNVIKLSARIIQVRNILRGDRVGYGGTYTARKNMSVGTISIGYADGFFRYFKNNFDFYCGNKKIKIIGRISMDLITIDVSNLNLKNTNKEIFIEIINKKNNVNYLAKKFDTIPNEILTSLGSRFNRKYFK